MVDLLIVADLGAAGNLVKNIVVQSHQVDFPCQDRLDTVLRQYPNVLRDDKSNWLNFEYRLRNWEKLYGIYLSDCLDWKKYQLARPLREKSVVFLNHSAFYQIPEFLEFYQNLPTLSVLATDDWQLKWQVRAYVEKKGLENLHDFTFETDREQQIKNFIDANGKDAYHRINIINMFEIMKQRASDFVRHVDTEKILPLQWLITPNNDDCLLERIENCLEITIPTNSAKMILESWRKLHWDPADTLDWKWWR